MCSVCPRVYHAGDCSGMTKQELDKTLYVSSSSATLLYSSLTRDSTCFPLFSFFRIFYSILQHVLVPTTLLRRLRSHDVDGGWPPLPVRPFFMLSPSFSHLPLSAVSISPFTLSQKLTLSPTRSCQTCPGSWCEDCFETPPGTAEGGEGDIEAVGDVLPELALLGYGAKSQAFWIRCTDCLGAFLNAFNSAFPLKRLTRFS
jgi:hypothetical protein